MRSPIKRQVAVIGQQDVSLDGGSQWKLRPSMAICFMYADTESRRWLSGSCPSASARLNLGQVAALIKLKGQDSAAS